MSSSDATGNDGAAAGGNGDRQCGSSGGIPKVVKKTNVCLICGIYTNLSLNIFEPRSGPNIREVIYQKYNFRAERGDNVDKYICYSCNNWLINWYSLQHLSETRNYESTPSSSRSQSQNDSKRSKNQRSQPHSTSKSSRNKENLEQCNLVSSTVVDSPKRKCKRSPRNILKESLLQQKSSPTDLFESYLIQMLEKQGTSVIKENVPTSETLKSTSFSSTLLHNIKEARKHEETSSGSSDIILSFNSALSELTNMMPSFDRFRYTKEDEDKLYDPNELQKRLTCSLSISLVDKVPLENNQTEDKL
ncbi:uncharacterized protein LOC128733504 [Sabethes cyaneus]|uniref:uncharacterized protein LOC128733504 n=1 Tax=Sabethes cyaneus TaxID=53552 RepID=UPI00237E5EE7|nr:uncharacterized protein LOC128733504 [Sabethes cyaneus]